MIIDISPTISESLAVWPGDTKFSREWICKISQGDNIDLSTIHTTVHLGAHADAPSHYSPSAETIDQVSLDAYCGKCFVFDIQISRNELICWDHIKDKKNWESCDRLLFKTASFPNPNYFNSNFAAFSPELIQRLTSQGTKLIGIDTPSFDPFDSKFLPAHQELLKGGARNLEGLVLDNVSEGVWELIALPLKLKGADASPVRAILRPWHGSDTMSNHYS